jgi:hypothetical protein
VVLADEDWRTNWREIPQWGGRVGFIDNDNTLWVKLHIQNSEWVPLVSDVQDFQLMDWRLCVLKNDGTLLLGEKKLNEPLEAIDSDVLAFQMTQTRIGTLKANGDFCVKEVGFDMEKVADNVVGFHFSRNRVAILKSDGSLWMHQGGAIHNFTHIADNVTSFQLAREYIAYVQQPDRGSNRLMIAKGNLWDPLEFVEIAGDISDFEMEVIVKPVKGFPSQVHVAAVKNNGQLQVGEHSVMSELELADVFAPVALKSVRWSMCCLSAIAANNGLYVAELDRDGTLGDWTYAGIIHQYCMNSENTVVLSRRPGEMRMIKALAVAVEELSEETSEEQSEESAVVDETVVADGESEAESLAADKAPLGDELAAAVGAQISDAAGDNDTNQSVEQPDNPAGQNQVKILRGFDWASEELMADGVQLFGLSSVRPEFIRRPVYFRATFDSEPSVQQEGK